MDWWEIAVNGKVDFVNGILVKVNKLWMGFWIRGLKLFLWFYNKIDKISEIFVESVIKF